MPNPKEIQSVLKLIEDIVKKYGHDDIYYVGGYARAMAMGLGMEDVHDLDVASGRPGRAQQLAGFVAEAGHADDMYEHHRITTITVTIGNVEIDFQGNEPHNKVAPYVRLSGVEETPIAMNIFDRDFTANALAIKVGTDEILDMTKRGMNDIKNKVVRTIIPAEIKTEEDPLIITRAIKLACKYNFSIDPELWKYMMKNANLVSKKLTPERVAVEAFVLSKYPQSRYYIDELGIKYLEVPEFIEIGREAAEE